jgi:AraC family transcriptional regulator
MDQSLTPSCFAATLPTPPQTCAEWSIFSVCVVEPPRHFSGTFADHILTLQESGTFRARQSIGGRPAEGWCRSGCVGLVPASHAVRWESLDDCGGSRAISLFIPHAFIARVVSQDWDAEPRKVELAWKFLGVDPIAEGILSSLASEARNGSPSGQMYAESACEFLANHIIRRYSSLSRDPPRIHGGLTQRRLNLVTAYINEHVAQPIALRTLAALAGVSPRHFERAFRQSVGMAPYAYVMQTRVATARRLLIKEPALKVEEIALRTGFCNSSHLGLAFRRRTGYSPSAYRATQLR